MPHSKPVKPAAKSEKPASEKKPGKEVAAPKAPVKAAKGDHEHAPAHGHGHDAKPKNGEPKKTNGDTFPTAPDVKPPNGGQTTPFLVKQHERLLHLRDNILDSMNGVAKDTLRSRAEGSEASAFGMHQADAGSDAYDRDFALSLLSQEQDALYEIEEALKRIELGTYGVCEMSGKSIAHARLEAIPFARYTVECQAQIEKMTKMQRSRAPVTSLFGLTDAEESGDGEEEESTPESKE